MVPLDIQFFAIQCDATLPEYSPCTDLWQDGNGDSVPMDEAGMEFNNKTFLVSNFDQKSVKANLIHFIIFSTSNFLNFRFISITVLPVAFMPLLQPKFVHNSAFENDSSD